MWKLLVGRARGARGARAGEVVLAQVKQSDGPRASAGVGGRRYRFQTLEHSSGYARGTCVAPGKVARRDSEVFSGRGRDLVRLAASSSEFSTSSGPSASGSVETVRGRVVSHRANFVHVRLQGEGEGHDDGAETSGLEKDELLCVTRQVLKKMKRQVLVGDFVEVSSIDWTLGHGVVKSVLPRQSIFQTPAVANVEVAILMFALRDPPIEAAQVNRFLVAAEGAKLDNDVVVVLNKSDIVPEEVTQGWVDRLASWGYRAIPISANTGEGVERVCSALEGKLGVIVGPSGVGKSSLINAINTSRYVGTVADGLGAADAVAGEDEDEVEEEGEAEVELLEVGEVSARTGRGKHTTRNISLINLANGGFLADTPGFNQPHLMGISSRDLPLCFPEIVERVRDASPGAKCEFKNCIHIHEPGCIVRGEWERYPMYVDLYRQVKAQEDQDLKMGTTKETREGHSIKKIKKGGKVETEPRLNRKKHRRTSRKLSKQQFKQAVMEDDWDEY